MKKVKWVREPFTGNITCSVGKSHPKKDFQKLLLLSSSGLNGPDREDYVFADRENYAQKKIKN